MRSPLKSFFLFNSLWLGLAACTPGDHAGHDHNAHNHASPEIVISDARVRPPLPGRNITAGYFSLNSNQSDRLIAVSSPASGRIELHTHIDDDGIMRMRRIDGGIEIKAGEDIVFEPGGFHIMLFDADISPETEDVALTFDFETAPDVTIIADIMSPNAGYGSGHGSDSGSKQGHEYGSGHGSDKASGKK